MISVDPVPEKPKVYVPLEKPKEEYKLVAKGKMCN
jgi:hypothetical protein